MPDVVPYSTVVGVGYVGWTAYDQRLVHTPMRGGKRMRVPGRIASGTWPVADGHLVTYSIRERGRSTLQVLKVVPAA